MNDQLKHLTTTIKRHEYLFCLKELHDMEMIDDLFYREEMRKILELEGFRCDQKFWKKGIG